MWLQGFEKQVDSAKKYFKTIFILGIITDIVLIILMILGAALILKSLGVFTCL